MYAYIRGTLIQSTPAAAVIETSGIGYRISIPANVFAKLPALGTEIQLHLSFIVREQSHTLYGFLSEQERILFDALLAVSGIGPKSALSLIGHLSLQDLHRAIHKGELNVITKVPGIGKKTAERLIIEMRDKVDQLLPPDPSDLAAFHALHSDPAAQKINDAMNALINLGYNQATAQKALKKSMTDLPEGVNLAELITHALSKIGS